MTNSVTSHMEDETREGGPSLCLIVALLATLGAAPCSLFGQDAPSYLPQSVRPHFDTYARQPADRAFALGPSGWGTAHGHPSLREARDVALANCREHANQCVVIAENDAIVRGEDPFPDPADQPGFVASMVNWSAQTVLLFALSGLLVLVLGTIVSARYPLYLFDTVFSDVLKIQMNYTVYPFGAAYFFCMLPVFIRTVRGDVSGPLIWIVFPALILPFVISVGYLKERGVLFKRFELD